MTVITSEPFGTTSSGASVTRFTLQNDAGMRVNILSYGCTVQSVIVPDANGTPTDVVLGYDGLPGYETGSCWFGALVGRYANRIQSARFELNGRTYFLEQNDGENHLHGVYSHRVFDGGVEDGTLVFRRVSPAGEEGYPGTLALEVRCRLCHDNALSIEYRARTDADTVLNLTNHSYFNLNGDGADVLGHELTLLADRFTECDAHTLPTGRLLSVEGTPMDFRGGKRIGAELFADYGQLSLCRGYDHNYVLNGESGTLRKCAEAVGDRTGIRMACFTTQPAVQLYTGNFVDEDAAPRGKGGVRYPRYGGFCLETQHYPCSPNFPSFPSTILRPGELYRHETIYQFS